jgi:hypothetical protein
MPKVSVIIPCYNQGQYVDEAVDSVLAQTNTISNISEALIYWRKQNHNISTLQAEKQNYYARLVNRKQLMRLRIEPTDNQLDLHYLLVRNNVIEVENNQKNIMILRWLNLLAKQNRKNTFFKVPLFNIRLCKIWNTYFSFENSYTLGLMAIGFITNKYYPNRAIRAKLSFVAKCIIFALFKIKFKQ